MRLGVSVRRDGWFSLQFGSCFSLACLPSPCFSDVCSLWLPPPAPSVPPPPTHTHTPHTPPHTQVETLFHEFGHAAQHMLTEQQEGLVAGIRGVEWDAVELPSQVCPGCALGRLCAWVCALNSAV